VRRKESGWQRRRRPPGATQRSEPHASSQGRLRYFEAGTGPPIVFLHGLLVNANLWRKVVATLSREFRCVALDLPLGSHTLPMPMLPT
jgi:pimeloyl-ACP methyl ester carboxylesterase